MTQLSGYRIMWVMSLFDLPTNTKSERKQAHDFREFLRSEGFSMAQFSVYARHTTSREQLESLIIRIQNNMPKRGKVDILTFTDKQYGSIINLRGKGDAPPLKKPNQLTLF